MKYVMVKKVFFFFQAEDGIRDLYVTGVQTCALPISTGEDVTDHDMGGSQVHCYESGVGDNEVDDDAACVASVRRFLSYLPSNNSEPPPRMPSNDPPERLVDGLEKIVPSNPRAAYDVKRVIKSVFDEESWFEIKPTWAKNIVIGF